MNRKTCLALGSVLHLVFMSFGWAEEVRLTAELSGASEVPPNQSAASGSSQVVLDTDNLQLKWEIQFSGIPAGLIGAHIHGPASVDANAGILVPLDPATNPIRGTAQLNQEQAAYILDGKTYINLHTEQFPSGELRGQLTQ